MQALARVADQELTPLELARWANRVEVAHFGAPGGHMDHVASALGGTLRVHSDWNVERLERSGDGVWVVVDSGEPKDTRSHLARCKSDRLALVAKHGGRWCAPVELSTWDELTDEEQNMWRATWENQRLEAIAAQNWSDHPDVPKWMAEHHAQLRDGLGLSTPQLDRLGEAAMSAGAMGWKVVGSGGGGCGLAWVPARHASQVHEAVRMAGAAASWTLALAAAHVVRLGHPQTPCCCARGGRSSRMKHADAMKATQLTLEDREILLNRPKAMLPVGIDGKPFLAYLIDQMWAEGIDESCIVLSAEDSMSPKLLEPWLPPGMRVDFTRQTIPPRKTQTSRHCRCCSARVRSPP